MQTHSAQDILFTPRPAMQLLVFGEQQSRLAPFEKNMACVCVSIGIRLHRQTISTSISASEWTVSVNESDAV